LEPSPSRPVAPPVAASSLDPAEVEKFSALAAEWWNPEGKFAVLHKFNPVRLAYVREQLTARFGRDPFHRRPYEGLSFLDIGCGGGLLSEPMARLGAEVTGIDPSERNIGTARHHAEAQALSIDYRVGTAEALAGDGRRFDVILNMEVIEHVLDPAAFMATCASLLKPGGFMVVSTINRTLASFALAIVGAEYVLGWLPRGTHHWEKFITPEEMETMFVDAGLRPVDCVGVVYSPLSGSWSRSANRSVNYMSLAERPVGAVA
jgi:2-polyprenyl-6-hydroxyphenyl methylase/3-demethylubiquinone-9 3-methyltransferase